MERKATRTERVTLIVVGLIMGMLLSGTAVAASYLTRTQANKFYLENTKTFVTNSVIAGNASQNTSVDCPQGWQAVGGGVEAGALYSNLVKERWSAPVVDGYNLIAMPDGKNPASTGWAVRVENENANQQSYTVAVICTR